MFDPYVYPSTDVLKNILDIKDRKKLDDAEADYVSLRLRELVENPLAGDYGFTHITKMHKYIFQDIYEWAGKIRTINMEKEEPALGGLSIEYSDKAEIREDLSQALVRMISRHWKELSLDDRVKCFSEDLAAVWKVHGFREGNTRLTVTFCCQFIEAQGIPVDRSIFEKHSTYVRTALVAYCAVFHDLGDLSKKEYLERIIRDALEGAAAVPDSRQENTPCPARFPDLRENINKLHTTELGYLRIRKNLALNTADVVEYCKNKILDKDCKIYRQGKNWYCEIDHIKITVNAYSYTIITAHITK